MLEKVISITNVGKFTNYNCQGDVAFFKLTVIYAGNGHGKTTLCDILRSLHAGDGSYIVGRETLGGSGTPTVRLRINNQNRVFANGAWDQPSHDFLLFDLSFVHQNVYSGEQVTHSHKKNLYQVIVGDTGVTLSNGVTALDKQLRDATADLTAKTAAVQAFAPTGMTVKEFLALPQVENVDGLIQRKAAELATLESAAAIQAKPFLRELASPQLPSDYADLLSTTLEGVSADIGAQVTAHMMTHTNGVRESWLSDGLRFIKDDRCPFCGQMIHSVPLIPALTAYFGHAYNAHIQRISQMRKHLTEQVFPPARLLAIQETSLDNVNRCHGWHPLLSLSPPPFAFDMVSSALESLSNASFKLLAAKQQAPFDAQPLDSTFLAAQHTYAQAQTLIDTYNAEIKRLNHVIQLKKTASQAGNLMTVQRELATLHTTKRRLEPGAATAQRQDSRLRRPIHKPRPFSQNMHAATHHYTVEVS
jgi:wobble nucleotide-excising tRNase